MAEDIKTAPFSNSFPNQNQIHCSDKSMTEKGDDLCGKSGTRLAELFKQQSACLASTKP
jgi:hypothetical protein